MALEALQAAILQALEAANAGIAEAVAAERDRCAKIADETAEIADSCEKAGIAQWIAERILSGESPTEKAVPKRAAGKD
jgi:hypothetical protein